MSADTSLIYDFFNSYPAHTFKPNDYILEPEETVANIHFIKKGNVRQYTISPSGVELTIHIFAPLAYFPLPCILNQIPNRYYYEALTPVTIISIPTGEFLEFIEKNPQILYPLLQRILTGLDKLTYRLELLSSTDAYQRTISTLLFLHHHFGTAETNDQLNLKFSHQQIASIAGLTRETVSRQLNKLTHEGYITSEHQRIGIPDPNKLFALLQIDTPLQIKDTVNSAETSVLPKK